MGRDFVLFPRRAGGIPLRTMGTENCRKRARIKRGNGEARWKWIRKHAADVNWPAREREAAARRFQQFQRLSYRAGSLNGLKLAPLARSLNYLARDAIRNRILRRGGGGGEAPERGSEERSR